MLCSIESCGRPLLAKSFCGMHYARNRRWGNPYNVKHGPNVRAETRFFQRFNKNPITGCWDWDTPSKSDGYGTMWVDGKAEKAHRFAYELLAGPIPEGLTIDHLCRNRGCVNPKHLEPVTLLINMRRGDCISTKNAAKTHCPHGHQYNTENTYVSPRGGRTCRTCKRLRSNTPERKAYMKAYLKKYNKTYVRKRKPLQVASVARTAMDNLKDIGLPTEGD